MRDHLDWEIKRQTLESYFNITILHGTYNDDHDRIRVHDDELTGKVVPLIKNYRNSRHYSFVNPTDIYCSKPIKCDMNSITHLYGLDDLPLQEGDYPIDMSLIGQYQQKHKVIIRVNEIIRQKRKTQGGNDAIVLQRSGFGKFLFYFIYFILFQVMLDITVMNCLVLKLFLDLKKTIGHQNNFIG